MTTPLPLPVPDQVQYQYPTAYVIYFTEVINLAEAAGQRQLFDDADITTLKSFVSLSEGCKCLLSRLIMRQGPVNNACNSVNIDIYCSIPL